MVGKDKRKALIVGASGLIGRYCLQELLDEPTYSEVTAVVRKPLLTTHRKLKVVVTDFKDIKKIVVPLFAHDVFCCIGTTIKKAGSQQAFSEIDFSLVVAVAESMKERGAEQFLTISSLGADKNSHFFYSRTKGEMEEALINTGYNCLRIFRPSLLLGSREEFRLGEKVGILFTPLLKPILRGSLRKYAPVEAKVVAQFMVMSAQQEPITGVHVYESNRISAHSPDTCNNG